LQNFDNKIEEALAEKARFNLSIKMLVKSPFPSNMFEGEKRTSVQ
jgi:hypothetical protein